MKVLVGDKTVNLEPLLEYESDEFPTGSRVGSVYIWCGDLIRYW